MRGRRDDAGASAWLAPRSQLTTARFRPLVLHVGEDPAAALLADADASLVWFELPGDIHGYTVE